MHQIVSGSDHLAGTICILLFLMWLINGVAKPSLSEWHRVLPAALLGLGLSSRMNFVLIMPLVFSMLVQIAGWKKAISYLSITGIFFIVVTVPFYVYDPQNFSPLNAANKITVFDAVLSNAGIIIPLVTGLVAVGLSFQRITRFDVLCMNCAIVQVIPILAGVILYSVMHGYLDFNYTFYGSFFLYFGALAFSSAVLGNSSGSQIASETVGTGRLQGKVAEEEGLL